MKHSEFKLSDQNCRFFDTEGYLIVPQMLLGHRLDRMQALARQELETPQEPCELEAQLGYPGAPATLESPGGNTVRRLLGAYQRHTLWQDWATSSKLTSYLHQLFTDQDVYLSQAHHNCLMTKCPHYSSDTSWHQDARYWSFRSSDLISAWLALGVENAENGGLKVIPGSHKLSFHDNQFDKEKFFRTDLEPNRNLINNAKAVDLNPGDVLFFDCKLLHSASRNNTSDIKYSLVFTYHSADNLPITGTRSASQQEILLR